MRALLPFSLVLFLLLAALPVHAADAGGVRPAPVFRPSSQSWVVERDIPPRDPPAGPALPGISGGAGAGPADRSGPGGAGMPLEGRTADWTFAPNVRPHPETTGQHLWPDIAARPDGTVGLAWMDDHAAGGYHIFYSASTDGGATWTTPEKVDTRVSGAYSKFVSIAFAPSGIPVAVWEDDRNGVYNVYFSKRDPAHGGTPWTPEARVNTAGSPPSGSDFMDASIAVLDESRYFVAWTDWREGIFSQVYMRATQDGGATWGAERRISDEIGYQPLAGAPCLVVDPASGPVPGSEILYCVMNDWRGYAPGGRYPDVYFSRSTNGGAAWSNGVRVNDVTDAFQQCSSHALVRLQDGALTAGWLNNDWVVSSFRTSVSTDQGVTWGASVRVDDPAMGGTGTVSSIVGFGSGVFAGFDVYQTDWNSMFRESGDGGRSWSAAVVRMDDDASGAASGNTVLAALSATRVCGAWQDTRPGTGAWKIYASGGTRDLSGVGPGDGPVNPPGRSGSARPGLLCFPNPSAGGQIFRFRILDAGGAEALGWVPPSPDRPVRADICDAAGRLVVSLSLVGLETAWDGRDAAGRLLPSGVYCARRQDDSAAGVRLVRVR